jgi:hypothetical protein
MSFVSCYQANAFVGITAGNPYPVGTILTPSITALPLTQATNTFQPVIAGGFTLPAGVWEIDCAVMTELAGPADATSATVDCIAQIVYNATVIAQNDTGSYLAIAGSTQSLFRGVSVSGSVISTGIASALQVNINCETADGGQWGTLAPGTLGTSQFIRCVRVA